jgi:hypothetical protein
VAEERDLVPRTQAATAQLYGQKQFPEAVARGKCKITGKAKFAYINGKQLNDIFFGQTLGVGMKQISLDEAATIPATPFQVTVANAANYVNDVRGDQGVRYTTGAKAGQPLTKVASSPAAGQYSVNTATGVYTFAAADTGSAVIISYLFTVAASGTQLNITNQLMGFAPTVQISSQRDLQRKPVQRVAVQHHGFQTELCHKAGRLHRPRAGL